MLDDHCDITERERTVAQHLLNDPSIVAAAEEMKISPFTVRSHLHEMSLKTGTETTQALLDWARRHELCCCR